MSAQREYTALKDRLLRCSKEAIVQFLLCRLAVNEENVRSIEEIELDRQLNENQKRSEAAWKRITALEKQADELRNAEKFAELYRVRATIEDLRDKHDSLNRAWRRLLDKRFPDAKKPIHEQVSEAAR